MKAEVDANNDACQRGSVGGESFLVHRCCSCMLACAGSDTVETPTKAGVVENGSDAKEGQKDVCRMPLNCFSQRDVSGLINVIES